MTASHFFALMLVGLSALGLVLSLDGATRRDPGAGGFFVICALGLTLGLMKVVFSA